MNRRSAPSQVAKPSRAKYPVQRSRSSAAQSNVAHHTTNAASVSTTGVTQIVATSSCTENGDGSSSAEV